MRGHSIIGCVTHMRRVHTKPFPKSTSAHIKMQCACSFAVACRTPNCNGNGICQSGRCRCFQGWEGDGCGRKAATLASGSAPKNSVCSGRGRRLSGSARCTCDSGFVGENCEKGEHVGQPGAGKLASPSVSFITSSHSKCESTSCAAPRIETRDRGFGLRVRA